MNRPILAIVITLGLAVFVAAQALFTVSEGQQALVFRFGRVQRTFTEPGLKTKLPFIENALIYEKRVLDLDPEAIEIPLKDQRRIVVDTFARFVIADPRLFHIAMRAATPEGKEAAAQQLLTQWLNQELAAVIAQYGLEDVLSPRRVELMQEIQNKLNDRATGRAVSAGEKSQDIGVRVIDVRIRRTDLPDEISNAVYNRMISEREQEAARLRTEGEKRKLEIEAEADRFATVRRAEAERTAQTLRGEGDEKAIAIYADAYSRDPEFYAFYRSMEAYRQALGNTDTTLVLSPDSEFFRYFGDSEGE